MRTYALINSFVRLDILLCTHARARTHTHTQTHTHTRSHTHTHTHTHTYIYIYECLILMSLLQNVSIYRLMQSLTSYIYIYIYTIQYLIKHDFYSLTSIYSSEGVFHWLGKKPINLLISCHIDEAISHISSWWYNFDRWIESTFSSFVGTISLEIKREGR